MEIGKNVILKEKIKMIDLSIQLKKENKNMFDAIKNVMKDIKNKRAD